MKQLYIPLIAFGVLVAGCKYTQKASNQFVAIYNTHNQQKQNSQLQTNGSYLMQDSRLLYRQTKTINDDEFNRPLVFFKDGTVLWLEASTNSEAEFKPWLRKFAYGHWGLDRWGVYEVSNDTVHAVIYLQWEGRIIGTSQLRETHFKGIIKNGFIAGWHMVEPMPNIDTSRPGNSEQLTIYRTATDAVFTPGTLQDSLDTHKAWINKYFTKKW